MTAISERSETKLISFEEPDSKQKIKPAISERSENSERSERKL